MGRDWPQTVDQMDRRWRGVRDEQRVVIGRLLRGETLSTEFVRQQAELVDTRARLREVQSRVDAVLDRMVGKRGSPVAREVCRLLEEPADPPADASYNG